MINMQNKRPLSSINSKGDKNATFGSLIRRINTSGFQKLTNKSMAIKKEGLRSQGAGFRQSLYRSNTIIESGVSLDQQNILKSQMSLIPAMTLSKNTTKKKTIQHQTFFFESCDTPKMKNIQGLTDKSPQRSFLFNNNVFKIKDPRSIKVGTLIKESKAQIEGEVNTKNSIFEERKEMHKSLKDIFRSNCINEDSKNLEGLLNSRNFSKNYNKVIKKLFLPLSSLKNIVNDLSSILTV